MSSRRKLLLVTLLGLALGTVLFFAFVERNLREPLMHIAQLRVKQIATEAINRSISEQVAQKSDAEALINWKMDNAGKVSGFMIDYNEHMRITSQTIQTVQGTMNEINHVPEHVPIGQALDSAILASFGPRVPVRFEMIGAAQVDLNTRQKAVGINNMLIEVYIRIRAEVAVYIPFDTRPQLVETEIPISYLLVVGDVPMYYYDNKGNPVGDSAGGAPSIALPLPDGGSQQDSNAEGAAGGSPDEALPAPAN
ncbi:sporulation protein YunB [Paenibacillus sp. IB182496]|uniref:Sporulation protein YunB n=2 Tax=Paenibacillus sabuli TaxID=2772509 RepID=A0A927BRT9_9BACL|nr:sporulation protein YunB [Paenibacillus sabuli]